MLKTQICVTRPQCVKISKPVYYTSGSSRFVLCCFVAPSSLDESAAILLNTDKKEKKEPTLQRQVSHILNVGERDSLQSRMSNSSSGVLLQHAGLPFRPRLCTVLLLALAYRRGHIFETSRRHLYILDAKNTFHTEDPRTLCAAVLNSVARSTWCPGLCTPGLVDLQ